jgi:Holliday junction DNA helicase RuvB
MATDRIISATASPVEEQQNWALRPQHLDEYIGQRDLIERVRIAIAAARSRNEPLEHVLLHGPPGLGKTSLAHVLAKEMGGQISITSGPALARATDLVSALTRLQHGDILFIDEIHRLPIAVEEFIYSAMEDFRIDVTLDQGLAARTVQVKCKPFTLIGATTRAGLLSSPLRTRFGIVHHLQYYTQGEIEAILDRSSRLLGLEAMDAPCLGTLAARSRGTVGLETIAATMNEDAGTLEDVVEPYLLQIGFLARTRRGRALTAKACDHLGLPTTLVPHDAGGLFEG